MPYILGVTGGIGSGKSAATDIFASLGIEVVDADIAAREVVGLGCPALETIAEHFGADILLASGELNRALLREKIFSQPDEKQWLENLLHPLIREQIINQLAHIQSPYGVLSSPLLFETEQSHLADKTVVIDCTEQQQLARAMGRDTASENNIKHIMDAQLSREQRNAYADDVIDNSGDIDRLQLLVTEYHLQLLSSLNS